jgi:hypothetical protein
MQSQRRDDEMSGAFGHATATTVRGSYSSRIWAGPRIVNPPIDAPHGRGAWLNSVAGGVLLWVWAAKRWPTERRQSHSAQVNRV